MPFGVATQLGSRNHLLDRGPDPPGKVAIWGTSIQPIAKCREYAYPSCSQYYQHYSVGGSSDAAFRCQYCSNLYVCNVNIDCKKATQLKQEKHSCTLGKWEYGLTYGWNTRNKQHSLHLKFNVSSKNCYYFPFPPPRWGERRRHFILQLWSTTTFRRQLKIFLFQSACGRQDTE